MGVAGAGDAVLDRTARMLRCLGHPIRLRILELLEQEGELKVGQIHESLHLEQAVCSQHLNVMRARGVLARRREGVHVYYRVADARASRVLDWIRGEDEV